MHRAVLKQRASILGNFAGQFNYQPRVSFLLDVSIYA